MDDISKELKFFAKFIVPITMTMLKTKHDAIPLRGGEVTGVIICPPLVGFGLVVLGHGKRQVTTSSVQSIHWDIGGFTIETLNSHYDVRVHKHLLELKGLADFVSEKLVDRSEIPN